MKPVRTLAILASLAALAAIFIAQTGGNKVSSTSPEWNIAEVATNLEVPWDIAVAPSGELFVTERRGTLRIINPTDSTSAIIPVQSVEEIGEGGLLGIALHPRFTENNYVYLFYTHKPNESSERVMNKISRFTLQDNKLVDEYTVVEPFPGHFLHNGGRIRFGPDGMLWAVTGDASTRAHAQQVNSLAGKVLRMKDDGTAPTDNPFPDSIVYSIGHRNPQGLDWHPVTKELIAVEHGDTGHDEVNIIRPAANYGWPYVRACFSDNKQYTNPLLCGMAGWAPSGGAFIGTHNPALQHSFFFAGLRGQVLKKIDVVNGQVVAEEDIIKETYGRLRAVVADGKGGLYVSTSNKDGRSTPTTGDDKILHITPK